MKRYVFTCCLLAAMTALPSAFAQISVYPSGTLTTGTTATFTDLNPYKFTYNWNFNTLANQLNVNQPIPPLSALSYFPSGTNTVFSCFVQDPVDGNYYCFVTDYSTQHLWRLVYGSSLTVPISGPTDLGAPGLPTTTELEGIDLARDPSTNDWYMVMAANDELIQIHFAYPGSSVSALSLPLTDPHVTTVASTYPGQLAWAHQLTLKYYNNGTGSNWHAFVANRSTTMSRIDFGSSISSLMSPPLSIVSIPNVGGVTNPCNFTLYEEGGNWYAIVPSLFNNSVGLYNFGSNLLSITPTGTNLNLDPSGSPYVSLTLSRATELLNDCEGNLIAYVFGEYGQLTEFNFNGSILNPPTVTSLSPLTGVSLVNSCFPIAYNNTFCLGIVDYNTLDIFNPFVTLHPNANLDYFNPTQLNTFSTVGTYYISLVEDMGRFSGPTLYCDTITVKDCPCIDSANLSATFTGTDPSGNCNFTVSAHLFIHSPGTCDILGYSWNGAPMTYLNTQSFTVTDNTTDVVTVTMYSIDVYHDTCAITKVIHLQCTNSVGTAYRQSSQPNATASQATHDISIYPNPAGDFVTVLSEDDIASVDVIDINGRKVGAYTFGKVQTANIPLSGLPSGTYLFRINESVSKVVIKK